MITKSQLRKLATNNIVKHQFEIPWNETSLSRLYDKVNCNFESGALIDIVSAKPISFIPERESLLVELELNVADALEEME
jgi:hypothetical protein